MISKTITAKGETFMKYTVILERGRESGYVASVPALRSCVSQGETGKRLSLISKKQSKYIFRRLLKMNCRCLPK